MIIRKTISGLPYWHAPHVPLPRVLLRPQLLQSQGTQHPERLVWAGWRENQQGRIAQNGSKLISPGKHLAIFFELGTDEHHQKKGRSSHTTPIWFWRTCTCGFTSNALQICQPNHWWSSTTSLHTVIKVPLAIVVDIGLCRVLFNLLNGSPSFQFNDSSDVCYRGGRPRNFLYVVGDHPSECSF